MVGGKRGQNTPVSVTDDGLAALRRLHALPARRGGDPRRQHDRAAFRRRARLHPGHRVDLFADDAHVRLARRELHLLPQLPQLRLLVDEHAAARDGVARHPHVASAEQRLPGPAHADLPGQSPGPDRRRRQGELRHLPPGRLQAAERAEHAGGPSGTVGREGRGLDPGTGGARRPGPGRCRHPGSHRPGDRLFRCRRHGGAGRCGRDAGPPGRCAEGRPGRQGHPVGLSLGLGHAGPEPGTGQEACLRRARRTDRRGGRG